MIIEITKLDEATWKKSFHQYAHEICFRKEPRDDHIDYALLATLGNAPIGYMTCREFSKKTVYWQFGGSFKPEKYMVYTLKTMQKFVDWHRDKYKYIVTYVENDNFPMLKIYAKLGFKIVGTRTIDERVLVEHRYESMGTDS